MKETKDADTAGNSGQMFFCQVDIDFGHGKQPGNDLHTCNCRYVALGAHKKLQHGDTMHWPVKNYLHADWGGMCEYSANEKTFDNIP